MSGLSPDSLEDHAPWWNEGPYLYVGRIARSKGVFHILSAWLSLVARLGTRCPDLWIAGGAPSEIAEERARHSQRRLLERLEAQGRLRWWGYLDEGGLSALLLKARVLIMHSTYEPGGRVVLEAMTQGVPVIATPNGFALDLVRDWLTGFLVSAGDTSLLRRRMEHFALQPLLGPSMGIAARATALDALRSWDFYRAHGRVYAQAAQQAEPCSLGAPPALPEVIVDRLPGGLAGRYPFAPVIPDDAAARLAAERLLGLKPGSGRIAALPCEGGALRWSVDAADRCLMLTHLYSTYEPRAIWDCRYSGPLFRSGRDRRRREAHGSRFRGFAAVAEDETGEFQLRDVPPGKVAAGNPLERLQQALIAFPPLWAEPPCSDDRASLTAAAAGWWERREMSPWRSEGAVAAALRRTTLRVAWPETEEKLLRGDLKVGARNKAAVIALRDRAGRIASREATLTRISLQHGEPSFSSIGSGPGGSCLLGGEWAGAAWWGRDAALLLLRVAADLPGEGTVLVRDPLARLCPEPQRRVVVLLWAIVERLFELAEAGQRDGFREEIDPFLETLAAALTSASP